MSKAYSYTAYRRHTYWLPPVLDQRKTPEDTARELQEYIDRPTRAPMPGAVILADLSVRYA